MQLVYKNKGILVPLYLIVCFIATAMLAGALSRNVGGMFSKINFYSIVGFALAFAALWTYLTRDDFYRDREGKRVKMDTPNELYWMNMKTWAIILLVLSVVSFSNALFNFMGS